MTDQQEVHPLVEKRFQICTTVKRWKELWDQATDDVQLEGLIHRGLDVPLYYSHDSRADHLEMILMYLKIADRSLLPPSSTVGNYGQMCRSAISPEKERDWNSLLGVLAGKAFRVLCNRFFNFMSEPLHKSAGSLIRTLSSDKLLSAIVEFFSKPKNIPDWRLSELSHEDQLCLNFLRNLIAMGWKASEFYRFTEYRMPDNDEKRWSAIRPQLLSITKAINAWYLFWKPQGDLLWESVTGADMKKIEKLALAPQYSFKDPYRSIEEAMEDGSQTATAYLTISALRQGRVKKQRRESTERSRARSASKVG